MRKSLALVDDVTTDREISVTPEILALLKKNAPVAIGVSGGKDSCSVAIATVDYLDAIKHVGPRILIHADLGVTEWADSLPTCWRLAGRLNMDLAIVRRPQGDMMDRWEQRWRDNVHRWESLSCVKLILPWSTPDMRFCTSEMKVDQITRHLAKLWNNRTIVNVTGIRSSESRDRAKAPVAKICKKLKKVSLGTDGWDWNPILTWTKPDVFAYLAEKKFELHEAYTKYGASRVSCVYCILATQADHRAGAIPPENIPLARRMIELEIASSFAFQGNRWLGDTLDHLLDDNYRQALQDAKQKAEIREKAESQIPDHLLYEKNWPKVLPTMAEAKMLGEIRCYVANALRLKMSFVTPRSVFERYKELMDLKAKRKGAA